MTDKTLEEAMLGTAVPEVEVKAPPKKKKAAKKKAVTSHDPEKIKVKNVSSSTLNLQNGQLRAGEEGEATVAECSTLHLYLERI